MGISHLVQIGLLGHVGRFDAVDYVTFPDDRRVICRTARGLETGNVMRQLPSEDLADWPLAGQLLRLVTAEDDLIIGRLERYRDRAFRACQQLIRQRGLPGLLVDVEHLFDGESVYFYFLGEVSPALDDITHELAGEYATKVRLKSFTDTLINGCGPGCGTGVGGCGTGGNCGSCGLKEKCTSSVAEVHP